MQIIPAILSNDLSEIRHKIKQAIDLNISIVHLDVMEKEAVGNVSGGCSRDLFSLNDILLERIRGEEYPRILLDIHLMVQNPAVRTCAWYKHPCVRTVIVHAEQIHSNRLQHIVRPSRDFALAFNPNKELCIQPKHLKIVEQVMLMGVKPGHGGQTLDNRVFMRLEELRNIGKSKVSIDGGVNESTIQRIVNSGFDECVSGSFFWKDPEKALKILQNI